MKQRLVLFGLLLQSCLLCVTCQKKPFDYRNPLLGNWVFTVERTELNTDSIGYYFHDTIVFHGCIGTGRDDDEISITYASEPPVTLKISKNFALSNFPTQYCNGSFERKDKLHLYLRWGGLGGYVAHRIDGQKQ